MQSRWRAKGKVRDARDMAPPLVRMPAPKCPSHEESIVQIARAMASEGIPGENEHPSVSCDRFETRIVDHIDARRRRHQQLLSFTRVVVADRPICVRRRTSIARRVDACWHRMKNWRTKSLGATPGVVGVESNHCWTPEAVEEYRIHLAGSASGAARRLHITQAAGSAWISSRRGG